MEVYKIQEKNPFMADSLNEFKEFEIYSLYQIIRYFDFHEERLLTYPFEGKMGRAGVSLGGDVIHEAHLKPFRKQDKRINFRLKMNDFNKFDRTQGNFKVDSNDVKGAGYLAFNLYREDLIRRLKYPSYYVYFKIPYQFIRNQLKTIICKTDLHSFYKLFDQIDATDYNQIVDGFRVGDIKFPSKIIEKKAKTLTGGESLKTMKAPRFKWRADMFPDMLHTVSTFGYAYPTIQTGTTMLFDGSHRLSVAPVAKLDYPVLLELDPKTYEEGAPIIVDTPGWFSGNRHLSLIINSKENYVGGFLLDPRDAAKYFAYKEDSNSEFPSFTKYGYKNRPAYEKFILKKAETTGYDFKWEL
jgi:hypothetical protein